MIFRIVFVICLLYSSPALAEVEAYFTPSADCETQIIKRINKAHKIEIAVYAINNDNIVTAIIKAHQQGKNIRIITDRMQSKNKYSKVSELKEAKIKLRTNRKYKIEHNKFAIFDDNEVVSGSFNWTNYASNKNSENCIFFSDKSLFFTKRFNFLWTFYK